MSRLLSDLSQLVRPQIDRFLESATDDGIYLLATCTLRTLEEQAGLWAQGRTAPGRIVTNAPPGESAHNYGLAIDVVPMVNGKPVWDAEDPIWQKVGAHGIAAGLEWLGSPGSRFPEKPHFQLPNWRDHIGTL